MRVLKVGVLDDADLISNTKPGAELFAPERIKWVTQMEGASQIDAMPPA